jgi:nitrile hydratase
VLADAQKCATSPGLRHALASGSTILPCVTRNRPAQHAYRICWRSLLSRATPRRVPARAWADSGYKKRLLADGTDAIAELGFGGPEGDHTVVVENTAAEHNVIVCTLCSCYPWPVLGLQPEWYKDPPYRARMVREPRALLAEMGCPLPGDVEIRVWDSSAEVRHLVLPQRPPGTEGMTETELAGLVTLDRMIGVARL